MMSEGNTNPSRVSSGLNFSGGVVEDSEDGNDDVEMMVGEANK